MLVCLSACSSVSPEAWRVAPIEFDYSLDGESARWTDVTYLTANVTNDTAGGFWTESAGSWLHIDQNGDTLRRFNGEMYTSVHGISAISPTLLVVSRTYRGAVLEGDLERFLDGSGLFLYDTDAETWTKVETDAMTVGDVAAGAEGRIVYVDFLAEMALGSVPNPSVSNVEIPFAIRAVASDGQQSTLLGPDAGLTAAAVAIDVDSAGTVYVSTERETFAIGADGTRTPLGTHPGDTPVLAVNSDGAVLARSSTNAGGATLDLAWTLARGSSAARDVMSAKGDCSRAAGRSLSIVQAGRATFLPFSCGTNGAAWLDENTFVLSIGDEGGTILALVTVPDSAVRRP